MTQTDNLSTLIKDASSLVDQVATNMIYNRCYIAKMDDAPEHVTIYRGIKGGLFYQLDESVGPPDGALIVRSKKSSIVKSLTSIMKKAKKQKKTILGDQEDPFAVKRTQTGNRMPLPVGRIYVETESDAPKGAFTQKGPRGGTYYLVDSSGYHLTKDDAKKLGLVEGEDDVFHNRAIRYDIDYDGDVQRNIKDIEPEENLLAKIEEILALAGIPKSKMQDGVDTPGYGVAMSEVDEVKLESKGPNDSYKKRISKAMSQALAGHGLALAKEGTDFTITRLSAKKDKAMPSISVDDDTQNTVGVEETDSNDQISIDEPEDVEKSNPFSSLAKSYVINLNERALSKLDKSLNSSDEVFPIVTDSGNAFISWITSKDNVSSVVKSLDEAGTTVLSKGHIGEGKYAVIAASPYRMLSASDQRIRDDIRLDLANVVGEDAKILAAENPNRTALSLARDLMSIYEERMSPLMKSHVSAMPDWKEVVELDFSAIAGEHLAASRFNRMLLGIK